MIKSSVVKQVLLSTWFQAAIPALVIILFLPALGSRYTLDIETAGEEYNERIYSDLNSDTIPEMIFSGKGNPYYYIMVTDDNSHIIDQWNLPGKLDQMISTVFTGNFDNDAFEEIYVFTHINDSLFLNYNELLQPSGVKAERIFITSIGYINNEVTSLLSPIGFFDQNCDGKKELYFGISTAHTIQPRKLFYYDIANRRLASSGYTANIPLFAEMKDINNDGRPEIFGQMSASGNYRSNVQYTDSSTWLMVFKDNLEFAFPPVEFKGFANGLETKGYRNGNFSGFILNHRKGGTDEAAPESQIMLFSNMGELVVSKTLTEFGFPSLQSLLVGQDQETDRIYLIGNDLVELNQNLDVKKSVRLPYQTSYKAYIFDIDYDEEDEILVHFYDEDKIVIYSDGLRKLVTSEIKVPGNLLKLNRYDSNNKKAKTFMASGLSGYFLTLKSNTYYYLMYLSFPGIYFLFYLFIILIKRLNTFQVVEKESIKQRLISLQLQGIKAQLDPHFTFNTLNSIASLIYLEDRQAAYDYLNKFTQLLRVMLNDAEKLYRSLGEEVDFVTTYLELEKLRFGDKFSYIIETGDGVSQKELVPKLVLQTFAENAIKHGIMPCPEECLLKITIFRENDYLKLTIEDNGIGREKAAGLSSSTGKGLKLTGEFYDILNQINKRPILHKISDLYTTDGNPSGTIVEVWVPVG
jgi:two-component sensor histidine kinase